MNIEKALKHRFPIDVVDALLNAYREIEGNFILKKWKASELDAGHFVEATRRIIEQELFATHTKIGKDLPRFADTELKRYEQSTGDESFRILIPRALKAVYNVRNKRGVGHLGLISPNEMDATYILYTVKWVLAELVRLASGANTRDTQKAIESIVERRLSVLWKHDGITRILETSLTAREQVLILLFDSSPQTEIDLQIAVEYKNLTNFRKILNGLHKNRLIEHQSGGQSVITTKGIIAAEVVLTRYQTKV
jgi:hypothetical protein